MPANQIYILGYRDWLGRNRSRNRTRERPPKRSGGQEKNGIVTNSIVSCSDVLWLHVLVVEHVSIWPGTCSGRHRSYQKLQSFQQESLYFAVFRDPSCTALKQVMGTVGSWASPRPKLPNDGIQVATHSNLSYLPYLPGGSSKNRRPPLSINPHIFPA